MVPWLGNPLGYQFAFCGVGLAGGWGPFSQCLVWCWCWCGEVFTQDCWFSGVVFGVDVGVDVGVVWVALYVQIFSIFTK